MANRPFFFDVPIMGLAQILPADATAYKTLLTGATNGTKVVALMASSDDSSNRDLQIAIERSSTTYILGTITLTATAGTDAAVPTLNLMDIAFVAGLPTDNEGNPFIHLESGDILKVKSKATITSAKTISIFAVGGKDA